MTAVTTFVQLPVATALNGTEVAALVQAGVSVQATVAQMAAFLPSVIAVTSFSGGPTGLTPATATSGPIVLGGTLNAAHGGTGFSSYALGDLVYAGGVTALAKLPIGSTGQVLTVEGGLPVWQSLSAVGVSSFSGGTTGLTPATATEGDVILAGTLVPANGGTGVIGFGKVTAKTANDTITAAQSYQTFSNLGAAGQITLALPAPDPTAGLQYTFAVVAAQNMILDVGGSVVIGIGEIATSPGGQVACNSPYSAITLKALSTTLWVAVAMTGSWNPV